jgi:nucleolin
MVKIQISRCPQINYFFTAERFPTTDLTMGDNENKKWQDAVISVLEGTGSSTDDDPFKVKKLRKLVLLSLQLDESDKAAKKTFKRTIQTLEEDGGVQLDADGNIKLKKKRKHREEKKSKKKKRSATETQDIDEDAEYSENKPQRLEDAHDTKGKNAPCKGNPQGVTRLFIGNLPFTVDETSLESFVPGLTHVKWITDKETGKFYGSAFVEMDKSTSAADAVAKAGSQLMGRPVKVNFAPALPGDKWPPDKKVISGGGSTPGEKGGQAGGTGIKAMSAKPDKCTKLFIGNLSYDIDDEGITKFFANVDAEVKAVRWIHHKDSGDFKGV